MEEPPQRQEEACKGSLHFDEAQELADSCDAILSQHRPLLIHGLLECLCGDRCCAPPCGALRRRRKTEAIYVNARSRFWLYPARAWRRRAHETVNKFRLRAADTQSLGLAARLELVHGLGHEALGLPT